MKLRIGALLATVAVIIAIIAFLRDWRRSLTDQDEAVPHAVPEKAVPAPPVRQTPAGGAMPNASAPQPALAKPAGNPATAQETGGSAVQTPGAVPRPAPVPAATNIVILPSRRARTSPGDPMAADEELKAGAIDAGKVNLMLRDYRTRMGENPVGTNAEIMKAVMGGNPKGAMLGPPDGLQINGDGELLDRWGTPYFFHQLSKTNMEIRSAGPDRKMYTEDDVVTH